MRDIFREVRSPTAFGNEGDDRPQWKGGETDRQAQARRSFFVPLRGSKGGALTIQNGFTHYPQKREIIRYFRGDVAVPERIILLDGSGSISFDVLSWLAEQKLSFIRIDWKGDIVCVAGASGYSANPFRVRWQLGNPRKS